jgi:hypothetical protein
VYEDKQIREREKIERRRRCDTQGVIAGKDALPRRKVIFT